MATRKFSVEFKICYQNNKCKNNKRIWNNTRETSEAFESEVKVLHATLLDNFNFSLKQLLDLRQKLQHDTEILEIKFYM